MGATERQKKATSAFMLKIAKHKIAAYNLKDTPEEYVAKSKARTEEGA